MKEWKGNKNSAHAAVAVHRGGGKSMRQEDDFYATDPVALEALLDHCSYWLHNQLNGARLSNELPECIWECACGNGNLSKLLEQRGYLVFSSDLKDRGYFCAPINFLSSYNLPDAKIILTNPPYSLAIEFIEHALSLLQNDGLYIALMNITYLAGKKRYERVYQFGCLRELYVFSKRVNCWKNGVENHDSLVNYCWYVFQKGYKGQPVIYWL